MESTEITLYKLLLNNVDGLTEKTAEEAVNLIKDIKTVDTSNLATKDDIAIVKASMATKDDIINLQRWMIGTLITIAVLILGLYAALFFGVIFKPH